MKLVTSNRANKILYNFIKSNNIKGKVLLPANICTSVVHTLCYAGLDLLFVDIQTDLCMDQAAALCLAPEASLLLFVHTYGVEQEYHTFFQQLRSANPNLAIVDDKCLCLPDLQVEDSPADLVLYSTETKMLVDLGGGAIGYVADRWAYDEVEVEPNDYLTNEQWLLDTKQLYIKMDAMIAHKERLNTIYRTMLPASVQLPEIYQHWCFNIMTDQQQAILDALFAEGLFASSHYASQSAECQLANNLHGYVINLFNDQYYTKEQAIRTCEIINSII